MVGNYYLGGSEAVIEGGARGWNWVGPSGKGKWSSVLPENRIAFSLMIVSQFILVWWSYINIPQMRTMSLAYALALTFVTLFYFLREQGVKGVSMIGLGKPKNVYLALGMGLLIGMPFLISSFMGIVSPLGTVKIGTPLSFLFIVGVAPFVEELFFGGLLTPLFSRRFGVIPALMAVGGIFAMFHYSVYGVKIQAVLWLFALRLSLSFSVLSRKSVTAGITGHTLVNFASALTALPYQGATSTSAGVGAGSLVMVALAVNKGLRRYRGHSISRETAGRAFGILFGTFAVVGIIILSDWTMALLGPPKETFRMMGMVLPYDLLYVLVPCHWVLLPWTGFQAYSAWKGKSWFLYNYPWLLMLALPLTITENLFAGPGTVIVLCICLFDALLEGFGVPLAVGGWEEEIKGVGGGS